MGTEPLWKLIPKMSLPSSASLLLVALYNVVDSYFVAKLDPKAFNAVSLFYPMMLFVIAISVGNGVGLNSVLSRALGEGDKKKADAAVGAAVPLGLAWGIIFIIAGFIVTGPFFRFFSPDAETLKAAEDYAYTVIPFSAFVFVGINCEKALQGMGDMVRPMAGSITGAVVNLILDPILIFGLLGAPKMGVTGAALATGAGYAASCAICVWGLRRKNLPFRVTRRNFRLPLYFLKPVYAVGLPAMLMQSVSPALVILINRLLSGYGPDAVSVMGAFYKIQSLVFMPCYGVTNAAAPVMGYNFGARNKERLLGSLRVSMIICSGVMLAGTAIVWLFPLEMLGFFNPTAGMAEIGAGALRVLSAGFVLSGIGMFYLTIFQSSGMAHYSLVITLVRQIGVFVGGAYALSAVFGLEGAWYAMPVSDFTSAALGFLAFTFLYRNKIDGFKGVEARGNV
jgi:putative MATE family efflux protein